MKRTRGFKGIISVLLALCTMAAAASMLLTGCAAKEDASAPSNAGSYAYQNYAEYETTEATSMYYDVDSEIEFNTEEYNHIEETGFKSPLTSPFSTFSTDVDTAAYTNIRRVINEGRVPDADMVRIEEMLNYFHYDYAQPNEGEPFSVNMEMTDCPWNADTKLLLVGLQAKDIGTEQLPDSNFVFLIDVSGSMYSDDKLPLVQQAFGLLTNELGENDRVSIVTYASGDRVVLEGAPGSQKPVIMEAIDSLEAGGGTAGADGINTAYKIAEKYFIEGGNNRVILATDGDLNIGVSSEGELTRLIESKRDRGIYLSVLGFGTGNIKDNKMEALADNGNGNYSYIDSLAEARRVLVSEMGGTLFTVAKDVKLQLDFNPAQVKGYRLIGYENRVMAAEDFADDTKDAGEIGAGHRVTVLYEIADKDSAMAVASPTSVYQQSADNGSSDMFTLNIRYKKPDSDTSELLTYPADASIYTAELSDNMRLAAAVTETGMLLRDSEFAGTSSYTEAKTLLKQHERVLDDESLTDFYGLISKLEAMCGTAPEEDEAAVEDDIIDAE